MGSRPAILGLSSSKKKKSGGGSGSKGTSGFKSGSRSSLVLQKKRPRLRPPRRP